MRDFEKGLDKVINGVLERNETPGIAILIGNRDGIILEKYYGVIDIDNSNKVNRNTIYDLASVSKILGTTMALLRLIEKGEVSIYDKLSTFYDVKDDKASITIKDMITHTAGFKDIVRLDLVTNNYEEAIQYILDIPLLYKRGQRVVYSDLGLILIGNIIEKITGKKLNEAVTELVLEPLDMKYTMYNPIERNNIASTERIKGLDKCYKGIVHDENARFFGGIAGHAGLFSNINDLYNFNVMLINEGMYKGEKFISKNLYNLMKTNLTKKIGDSRGIGWVIAEQKECSAGEVISRGSFGHTGFTGTSIWIDPVKDVYVTILSNRVNPTRNSIGFIRSRKLIHNYIFANT